MGVGVYFVIMLRVRKRRAAPQDIYPACKVANNCPPDIQNKIEQTTVADKILQYGSLGIFLGGLGIGTGKGGGGRYGYTPLGDSGAVRVGGRSTPVRPTVPVETVGPRDILPIDSLDPLGPSVIELEDIPATTVEVVAEVHPISDTPQIPAPTTDESSSAVLHIPQESPAARTVTRSQYNNPLFRITASADIASGEASASDNIFIDVDTPGQIVGQEIPLVNFDMGPISTEGELETEFTTSTPRTTQVQERPTRFYNRRYYEQVPVTAPEFITRPASLVTFENPAFERSVSLIFEQDLEDILNAPDQDFRDIVYLSRPTYSRAPDGRMRLSRLGRRATISTRSGVTIGAQSHFYMDISSISSNDGIELQTLGEASGETVVQSSLAASDPIEAEHSFIEPAPSIDSFDIVSLQSETYSDEHLLDMYEPVGSSLQLQISDIRGRPTVIDIPFRPRRPPLGPINAGIDIYSPTASVGSPTINPTDLDIPFIIIYLDNSTGDYDLHPSLRKRRKLVHI